MTSILGKRARSAIGNTKEAISNSISNLTAESPKRASLRARGGATEPADEEPPLKKRKSVVPKLFSFTEDKQEEKPKPKAQQLKKKKRWLRQGLYAGQKQDFDVKKPKGKGNGKDEVAIRAKNAVWALPLPMFGFLDRDRDFLLPFDIFNALPKGQPKPDEWKKTRSNQFVGDSKEVWRHMNSKMEQSMCTCTRAQGCDENCLNADMYYECDDSNCSIGPDYCKNRQFANLKERVKSGKKYDIGVEVQKYPNKGFGVRACRTFEPFQIIVEYSGEIITQEEALDRMEDKYKGKEDFYFMTFDQNMICDATRGSIARFVNHSCAPNCAMVKWTVNNKPRMALFAGEEGIMTGEELTYDYNFDPFSMKNVQTCHCGAPNCRGILGPRPKQVKVLDVAAATVTATVKGVKRKMTELVGGAVNKAPSSPAKRGTARGPTKKRRVSAPVPLRKAAMKTSPKRGRKGQRATSGATDKTLVDKENKTPSTKSGRSSSSSSISVGLDSMARKPTLPLKRHASGVSLNSTQSTLEAWFRTPSSTIKRAIAQTPLGGSSIKLNRKGADNKGKIKKRMSMPARLPGSRTSSRLVEQDDSSIEVTPADDGWVDNGVRGRGQWKYVAVVE